jgi:hypothetical protein
MILIEQVHPNIKEAERYRMCKAIDCQRLTPDACSHAAQNERLPVQMAVQVLYFEQLRLRSAIQATGTTTTTTNTSIGGAHDAALFFGCAAAAAAPRAFIATAAGPFFPCFFFLPFPFFLSAAAAAAAAAMGFVFAIAGGRGEERSSGEARVLVEVCSSRCLPNFAVVDGLSANGPIRPVWIWRPKSV